MANLFGEIKDIIVQELGVEREEIKGDSLLVDDLGADLLDLAEIVMACEEKYGVNIDDDAADKIRTPQQLMDAVQARQSGGGGG